MHIYFLVSTNTPATITAFSLSHNIVLLKNSDTDLCLSMSTAYLLLLFLCISLHACNGRHLSPLDKKLEKKPHFSVKGEEKNGFDSCPKKLNEANNNMKTRLVVADSEKAKNRRSTNQRVLKAMGKVSVALKTESLVSVSWRVPHKKRSQKHPGFNLDYSPPKTHPPSHN